MAVTALCTTADLYRRYGQANLRAMANLEAVPDTGAGATAITSRITSEITDQSAYIADRLRAMQSPLPLPESGAIPSTLAKVATFLVGYSLSAGRGFKDYDSKGKPITRYYADYDWATNVLEQIVAGQLKLQSEET